MLKTLEVVNYIFVKHGAPRNFTRIKLIDLVTNQMHGINLSIHRSLGLRYLVSESQIGIFIKRPASSALKATIIYDNCRSILDRFSVKWRQLWTIHIICLLDRHRLTLLYRL